MPEDDAWDWPLLLYAGTVILNRSEREFWRMSPRKLRALSTIHVELNSQDSKKGGKSPKQPSVKKGYIDQVF